MNSRILRLAAEIESIAKRANPNTTWTSRMDAITSPHRWGYEIVDVFFGKVRVRRNQTIAMKGDCLRDGSGKVWVFQGRTNNDLHLDPLD